MKFGKWHIKREWQVVHCTYQTVFRYSWGTKKAMRGLVGMLKATGKWNPSCHVCWRWVVYHQNYPYRIGRSHVRSMMGTDERR